MAGGRWAWKTWALCQGAGGASSFLRRTIYNEQAFASVRVLRPCCMSLRGDTRCCRLSATRPISCVDEIADLGILDWKQDKFAYCEHVHNAKPYRGQPGHVHKHSGQVRVAGKSCAKFRAPCMLHMALSHRLATSKALLDFTLQIPALIERPAMKVPVHQSSLRA